VNILITGGSGYIASKIKAFLSSTHTITTITRDDFDLCDHVAVNAFFENKTFDVVIHTATSGGSRLKSEGPDVLIHNLRMYLNLLANKNKFHRLISFGSGAEFVTPSTPYGLSKKAIAESISKHDNFYNIRIYAVFDEDELNTRFIKANITNYLNKQSIIIHQDKTMDFFYMKDLLRLVDYYITAESPPKEIDCTYTLSYKLSDIANIINNLSDYKVDVLINEDCHGIDYTGKHNQLISYIGVEHGIKEVYDRLKKQL
jgi:nucleoside-diphosphate-sugar epimerase